MLQTNAISMDFAGNKLFSDLSFRLDDGDKAALVGPNGAGKSTLLKIISNKIEPVSGSVSVKKNYKVGILDQEETCADGGTVYNTALLGLERLKTIEEQISAYNHLMASKIELTSIQEEEYSNLISYFQNHGGFEMDARISKVLDGLGFIRERWNEAVSNLSGGWRRRLRLAALLLEEPDVLLLDEPTNHLDATSIDWLENYINSIKGIVIMVSHDRYFIERICNAIIEISPGYSGFSKCSYTQYQNRKITREIQLKKAWTEQQEFIKKTQSFIDKFRYNASKSKQVQSRIKSLEKIVPVELNLKPEIMGLRFPDPPKSGTTVINACGLSKSYGDLKVFEDIDFNIDRGEKIAVSGTNGAGKTSLLKILSGRLDYESGIIEFGHNVIKGYFAQHTLEELNPEMTIIETMEEAAPVDLIPDLRTLLGCFLFASDDINKKVSVLSGGEKSRLALAKLLMRPFNLLIIDEPTNHLDVDSRAVLAKALKRYEGTLIIVSHDRFFTDQIVNRVIHLEEGKLYNHLGNLSSFIEKQRLALEESIIKDNFSKCENSSRSSFLLKGGSKTDQGLSKTERAKKLKVEREKRVVKRKMLENFKVLENEIHNLEIEIEEIRYRQSLPEIYSDPEKAADLARQVNWLENQLEDKLLIWEESAQNIDML